VRAWVRFFFSFSFPFFSFPLDFPNPDEAGISAQESQLRKDQQRTLINSISLSDALVGFTKSPKNLTSILKAYKRPFPEPVALGAPAMLVFRNVVGVQVQVEASKTVFENQTRFDFNVLWSFCPLSERKTCWADRHYFSVDFDESALPNVLDYAPMPEEKMSTFSSQSSWSLGASFSASESPGASFSGSYSETKNMSRDYEDWSTLVQVLCEKEVDKFGGLVNSTKLKDGCRIWWNMPLTNQLNGPDRYSPTGHYTAPETEIPATAFCSLRKVFSVTVRNNGRQAACVPLRISAGTFIRKKSSKISANDKHWAKFLRWKFDSRDDPSEKDGLF
jgi:hypothetical protein